MFSQSKLFTFGTRCEAFERMFQSIDHGPPPAYLRGERFDEKQWQEDTPVIIDVSHPTWVGQQCLPQGLVYTLLRSHALPESFYFGTAQLYQTWVAFLATQEKQHTGMCAVTPPRVVEFCNRYGQLTSELWRTYQQSGGGFQHYVGLSLIFQYAAISEYVFNQPMKLNVVAPFSHLHPDSQESVGETISSQVHDISRKQSWHEIVQCCTFNFINGVPLPHNT